MRKVELTISRNGFLIVLGICFLLAFLRGGSILSQFLVLLGVVALGYGAWLAFGAGKTWWGTWSETRNLEALFTETETTIPVPAVPHPMVYTIRVPKGTKWNANAAYQWMLKCILYPGLIFRIEGTAHAVSFQIIDLSLHGDDGVFQQAVHAVYPDAIVEAAPYCPPAFGGDYWRATYRFTQSEEFFRPSLYARDLDEYDPLVVLTNVMDGLQEGERLTYNLYVGESDTKAHKEGERLITKQRVFMPGDFLSPASWAVSLGASALAGREEKFKGDGMDVFREKLRDMLFEAGVVIQVETLDRERLTQFEVATPMLRYSTKYQNFVPTEAVAVELITKPARHQKINDLTITSQWLPALPDKREFRTLLNPHELAALWHVPHEQFTSHRIIWAQKQTFVPMPVALRGMQSGVALGQNGKGKVQYPVILPTEDRTMHTFILGKTGTGKSTLMHNLIHQDIANGSGLAVIDPKGDLVHDVLERSIPPERVGDVVFLDFTNDAYPVPLNLLRVPKGAEKAEAIGRVMAIFETLYEGFSGQMADTLHNALLTVMEDETPTLRDVGRLFRDVDYRYRLLERLENVAAEDFWASFNSLSPGAQAMLAQPVEHRLRTFFANKSLYSVLCHPDHLDFGALMNAGKIVLVSFSLDGKQGQISPLEQRMLGAVLIQQLQIAALSRAALAKPFYLYVDETQHFVTTPLHQILNEARSRNVGLVLANQYLKQLSGDTVEAVMGNVGAMVAFEVEATNAHSVLPYFRPHFEADDLVNLGVHRAAVRLRVHGRHVEAFSLMPLPPLPVVQDAQARTPLVVAESVKRYTPKSRQEVLDWLSARYPKQTRPTTEPETEDEVWYDNKAKHNGSRHD